MIKTLRRILSSPATDPSARDSSSRLTIRLYVVIVIAILLTEVLTFWWVHDIAPPNLVHDSIEGIILSHVISFIVMRLMVRPLHQEVTRRQEAERQATAERDKLESFTEAIGAGMVLLDRDHQVQWANRVMRQLFGATAGEPCYRSFKRTDGTCPDCGAGDIFSGKAERVTGRHRLTTGAGTEAWFDVIFTPVRDAASSTTAALELLVPADDRKRMEDALRISEERYRHLVESTLDQVWEIDSTGRFRYASQNSKEILGYEASELIGTRPFEYVISSERRQAQELFLSCVRETKPLVQLEHVFRRRDGKDITVQVSGVPFYDGEGALIGYRGITRDITRRKTSEAALRESEQNFRLLAELAGDGIIITREDGTIVFANRKITEITGHKANEIAAMRLSDLAPGDDGLVLQWNCQARIRGETVPDPYELSLLHRTGREVPVEITGARIIWGGIVADQILVRDISERKAHEEFKMRHLHLLEQQVQEKTRDLRTQITLKEREIAERLATEDALRKSEEQFRELFLQSEAALILFDASDDTIIDANPAALELFGYSREEFLSLDGKLLVVPESRQSLAEFLHAAHGMDRFNVREAWGHTRDGRRLTLALWGKVVRLQAREVVYCSITDISERIRIEEEKKLVQTKLIQVNRMNSLGLLTSGIAHEVNNPNTTILLSAQLLDRAWRDVAPLLDGLAQQEGDFLIAGTPVSEMRESLPRLSATIIDCSRRIEGFIKNLREFAVQGKATMADNVDLNRVASVAASILQHQVKRSTSNFRLSLAERLPTVQGNPQQLEQVVINLLMNALQSLPAPERAVELATKWDRERDRAVITVRDEGCGIPRENLQRVLDPFFSTKLEKGGSGLGLSITNFIVREHNGVMTIESTPGAGTTVTVRLPVRARKVNA